ncbi:MAG: hypothetical protein R3C11_24225 [Planctomycetaceae bacterium]
MLDYVVGFGGNNYDSAQQLATDAAGNLYTIGYFVNQVDFDPGPGTYNLDSPGSYGIFLSKFDVNGDFVWAQKIGFDYAMTFISLDVDSNGNIFTTGWYDSTIDFDPGPNVFQMSPKGLEDVFVTKYDSDGNFLWAKSIGGNSTERSYILRTDSDGNAYIGGRFRSTTDFDPGAAEHKLTSQGDSDIFLMKLDADGNFVWANRTGAFGNDRIYHLEVDNSGNVFYTGRFYGTVDFDPSGNTYSLNASGQSDVFVAKVDSAGNFGWARHFTGTGENDGEGIAVDANGNVLVAGYFEGTVDFDPGAGTYPLTSHGDYDTFTVKLDPSGDFIWARHFGGAGRDENGNVEVDAAGNVYSYGTFLGIVDFDPTSGTFELNSGADRDRHIWALDKDGYFLYATQVIDDNAARLEQTLLTQNGDFLVAGAFSGNPDFDPGPGVTNLPNNGQEDTFVGRYHQPDFLSVHIEEDDLFTITGVTATNIGLFRTNPGTNVTFAASLGTVTPLGNGDFSWSYTPGPGDNGVQEVIITATGTNGVQSTITFDLHVDTLESFDQGMAPFFNPQNPAEWSVTNGQYQVDSTGTNGLGVSLIELSGNLPANFEMSAEVTSVSGPDRWLNGF